MTIFQVMLYMLGYLLIGYYIAKLSVEVAAGWKESPKLFSEAKCYLLRFFLFPVKSIELIGKNDPYSNSPNRSWAEDIADKEKYWGPYLILSMIFWPFRFVWFALACISIFVAALIFSVAAVLASFVKDVGSVCKHIFTNSPSEIKQETQFQDS